MFVTKVPAMIIGIPVWVGRKLHAHYRLANKHKRNTAITAGVMSSVSAHTTLSLRPNSVYLSVAHVHEVSSELRHANCFALFDI